MRVRTAGFSLVELMVAVGIVGVLVTLAVPRYHQFMVQARRGEAKSNLSHIATLQETYKVDHFSYYSGAAMSGTNGVGYRDGSGYDGSCDDPATDVDEGINNHLGFRPNGCGQLRYFYQLRNSGNTAVASAASDAKGRHIYPDCSGGGTPPECGYVSGDAVRLAMNIGKPEVCRNITNYCPGSSTTLTPTPTPTCPSCPAATTSPDPNTVCAGDSFTQTITTTTCTLSPPCTQSVSTTSQSATGTKGTHNSATCTGMFDPNACTCTTTPPTCGTTTEQQQCNSLTLAVAEWLTSPPHCDCTTPGNYRWRQDPNDGCYGCFCDTKACGMGKTFDPGSDCRCKCDDTKQEEQCNKDAYDWDSTNNECDCGSVRRWQKNTATGCYGCECKTAGDQCTDGGGTWDGTNCSSCTGGLKWLKWWPTGCYYGCKCPLSSCPAGEVIDSTSCTCVVTATCDSTRECCHGNVSMTRLSTCPTPATWHGTWGAANINNRGCCGCETAFQCCPGGVASFPKTTCDNSGPDNYWVFDATKDNAGCCKCSLSSCPAGQVIDSTSCTCREPTCTSGYGGGTPDKPVSVSLAAEWCSSDIANNADVAGDFFGNIGKPKTPVGSFCSGSNSNNQIPYRFTRNRQGACRCTSPIKKNSHCVGKGLTSMITWTLFQGAQFDAASRDELPACYKPCITAANDTVAKREQCYAALIYAATSNGIVTLGYTCEAMAFYNSYNYLTEGSAVGEDCSQVEVILDEKKNGMGSTTSGGVNCNTPQYIWIQAPQ